MTSTSFLSTGPARERDLIDAAIAVNEAPSLDQAFAVLAETGLSLLGAAWLAVVVWDAGLRSGIIHAGAGEAGKFVGVVVEGDDETADAIRTGAHYSSPPNVVGVPEDVARALGDVATVVRVPLHMESCRATFHAAWRMPLDADEV